MDPGSILMLVVVMGIFYFMLVRPQKKRMKEHQMVVSSLSPGDEVVTVGGIYGFVNRVEDDVVFLEVAEGTEMRFTKQSVSRRLDQADSSDVADEEEPAEDTPEVIESDPTA